MLHSQQVSAKDITMGATASGAGGGGGVHIVFLAPANASLSKDLDTPRECHMAASTMEKARQKREISHGW